MTGSEGLPTRRSAVRLKTARGRKPSSQRWLTRQLNDPYVQAAKKEGWRSRAAFKLIDLDDKAKLIRRDCRIVDLGAAPGGWSQVALARGAASVVGIDLLDIDPVPGATFLKGDFEDPAMEAALARALGGQADLILSDIAPNATGHAATDHIRITALAEIALDFALGHLAPGGAFVCKLFQGGAEGEMLATLKRRFRSVRHVKPAASRKESRELYIVATGFR